MMSFSAFAQEALNPQIRALKAEGNLKKRYQSALTLADDSLTEARKLYLDGNLTDGKTQIDLMMSAVSECVTTLEAARNFGYYKRAEMKVSALLRRLDGVITDIEVDNRDYLSATRREMQVIHEKLLKRVMMKK